MKLNNLTSPSAWRYYFSRKRQALVQVIDPLTKFIRDHRPGAYYSPILIPSEYRQDRDGEEYWSSSFVDRNEVLRRHLKILRYADLSTPEFDRYEPNNDSFPPSDALTLSYFVASYKPNTIVEVGSGWSSAVILDTLSSTGISSKCVFVEPYPERLNLVLRDSDRTQHTVYTKEVQDVPLSLFTSLKQNDILFIDSSHILKACSDLAYLMLRVIPLLQRGVILHFHDIFYPFTLPHQWIERGWSWNEGLALRLMLTYGNFQILAFNSWFGFEHREAMARFSDSHGGSIWIQKL